MTSGPGQGTAVSSMKLLERRGLTQPMVSMLEPPVHRHLTEEWLAALSLETTSKEPEAGLSLPEGLTYPCP